jgi:hypothetical protein
MGSLKGSLLAAVGGAELGPGDLFAFVVFRGCVLLKRVLALRHFFSSSNYIQIYNQIYPSKLLPTPPSRHSPPPTTPPQSHPHPFSSSPMHPATHKKSFPTSSASACSRALLFGGRAAGARRGWTYKNAKKVKSGKFITFEQSWSDHEGEQAHSVWRARQSGFCKVDPSP